jgi:B12-binding domain/radical SAM domain protein
MTASDLILLHAPSVYDFRRRSMLCGPVSDLVPSTPVFEMYPIGFTTIGEYLERHGHRVRIINLAVRMLQDADFDVEKCIAGLRAAAFGIDLHWMPHAHGAIEIARIVKRLHPDRPVLFGGFSSTYFHEELIRRPEVDFVIRGDSTEHAVLELVEHVLSDGAAHPPTESAAARKLSTISNLVWKDGKGMAHVNPLAKAPRNLDHLLLDYSHVLKTVMRQRDLKSVIPFRDFLQYPITAALSVRGCRHQCATCGGSAHAYRHLHGRERPAFRQPEDLANDIRRVGAFSRGPTFILGDIRQAGDDYADRFLEAIAGYRNPVFLELFDATPPGFFRKVAKALPHFLVQISLESHDERVRRAFGRPYSTRAIERTMWEALDAGCRRLDLFFMIGLSEQTRDSVMGTVDYCEALMNRYAKPDDCRVAPFISPLAPFLDPGSRAFEHPERYGYRLRFRTLEEHRQALLAPSWKHVLNYETRWMDRDEIVMATYEAGRRLNRVKVECGLTEPSVAEAVERRIDRAVSLSREIDRLMEIGDAGERDARLLALKPDVDASNMGTVCDKRELEAPGRGRSINLLQAARIVAEIWWTRPSRRRAGRLPILESAAQSMEALPLGQD